ncbi:prepilin peptidase [Lentibacillus daqui]|uniref:prepilin peptidase n=1 Tax=Lentibacillus daqui TaxID=2911514 RepID=UPI0022B1034C|nr:A24 family peptidase [Lentibacillus daqui]
MTVQITVLFFTLGLIFGSFFNVVGLRLPAKLSFANDRSMCPQCKHILSWYELVPVLSYLKQLGRCRHCHTAISLMYPVIEVLTGLLFAYSYLRHGLGLELVIAICFMSMLVIILVADISYMLIPDRVLLFFLPLFIILRVIQPLHPWWSSIVGGILAFVLIAVIILVSRGGMGAGDMKLFGVLGIVLGVKQVMLAFILSCMIGAIVSLFLLLLKRINRRQPFPFGPYIVVAAIISYFDGYSLINWYMQLFS